MSFSDSIKNKVLVECGRHCCICHRFVGVKMELHHIKPKADGGEDTYENCIPLCFDCHSDVGHYNDKHPKGTKFKEPELILHRDKWYERMVNAPIGSFDDEMQTVDREIFEELRELADQDTMYLLFREHCWGQAITKNQLDWLRGLEIKMDKFDSEFLEPSREGLRAEFKQALKNMLNSHEFFQLSPTPLSNDRYGLPKAWAMDGDEEVRNRYTQFYTSLNEWANRVYETYEAMIHGLRRQLVVK